MGSVVRVSAIRTPVIIAFTGTASAHTAVMKCQDRLAIGALVLVSVAMGAAIKDPALAALLAGVVTKWLGS